MPLVRYQIQNEFRLGDPKLDGEADAEDPKALLDQVAVSGLIGILRQLGDLAEFAAEVFHDLEEKVATLVSRSHKVSTRVQRIEAALPSLEKAVMAQTSHINFAYIAGFGCHADIQTEENHLTQSDLPQFIMNSYEKCREPPRLFLLDKFDTAGAGTCLKRYSDPSFFKTTLVNSKLTKAEEGQWEKKPHKSKRKGPRQKNGVARRTVSLSGYYSRMQLGHLNIGGQNFVAEMNTSSDMQPVYKFSNRSKSLDSKPKSNWIEHVSDVNSFTGSEELQHNELLSSSSTRMEETDTRGSIVLDEQMGGDADNGSPHCSMQGHNSPRPSSVSWDEKTEIVKSTTELCINIPEDWGQDSEPLPVIFGQSKLDQDVASLANAGQEDILFDFENIPESILSKTQFDETEMVKPTTPLCRTIPKDKLQDRDPLHVNLDQFKLKQDIASHAHAEQDILFQVENIPASFSSKSQFDEIVKPPNQLGRSIPQDQGQDIEPLPLVFDQSQLEQYGTILANADREDILFDFGNKPSSFSTNNQFDETETVNSENRLFVNIPENQCENLDPPAVILDPCKLEGDAGSFLKDDHNILFQVENIPALFSSKSLSDETEILKLPSQSCKNDAQDFCQNLELLPVMSNQSKWEKDSASFANADHEDILFHFENIPTSFSSKTQLDDISSETGNYIDVINATEAEVEICSECQTKWEVELEPNFKTQEMVSGIGEVHKVVGQCLESSDVEPLISSCSSEKEICLKASRLASSKNLDNAQPPPVSIMGSNTVCSLDTGLHESSNAIEMCRDNTLESISYPSSGLIIADHQVNKLAANAVETQESPEISGLPPIKFWTNGGLLGLEPSKPPVFNVSDVVASQTYKPGSRSSTNVPSGHAVLPKLQHDGSAFKSDALVDPIKQNSSSLGETDGLPDIDSHSNLAILFSNRSVCTPISHSEYSGSSHDKLDNEMPMKQISQEFVQAVSRTWPEKVKGTNGYGVAAPEDELHAISSNDFQSNEYLRNNTAISTSMSDIGRRLLVNGFWRKPSIVYNHLSDPCSVMSSDTMKLLKSPSHDEQKKGLNGVASKTAHILEAKIGLVEYPLSSESCYIDCPSPPLEHMKISFHPTDGAETTKLKLEFHDMHHLQGSTDYALFPLFQLLPEAACPLQDMGSESDEGTFYRSPPYLSEDPLSPGSESNSEEWDSHETAVCQDYEIYDALRRSSSAASVSGPYDLEAITHHQFGSLHTEDGIIFFDLAAQLDLFNLSAVDTFTSQREGNNGTEPKEQPAIPHPFPLLEWSITKPTFASFGDSQHPVCKVGKHPDGLQVRESVSQQPKTSAPHHIEEASSSADQSMHDLKMLDGSRELNEAANGKELPERADRLHRIRGKAFEGSERGSNNDGCSDG